MTCNLARIIPEESCPFQLFKIWLDEFLRDQKNSPVVTFNLATSSNSGDVKNRFVVLQKIEEDGFVFNTNPNGPKNRQIEENPRVAASFLFCHTNDRSENISRQVRIEGNVVKLSEEATLDLFEKSPLHAKVRAMLIRDQSVPVQWEDLKKKYDKLMDEINNKDIELKPENLIGYKIVPKIFDFYHAADNEIADRLVYECQANDWKRCHYTA